MQPIEGISPGELWTFLSVLVALAGLVILGDKVIDVWRRHQERKRRAERERQQEAETPVEMIGKRLDAIEERLDSIDAYLSSDKRRLEALESKQGASDNGFRVLCAASLAMLNHLLHNGNGDEMQKAQQDLQDYLIKR